MIRLILILIFLLFFFLFGLLVQVYLWVLKQLGKMNRADKAAMAYVQGALRTVEFLAGVQLTVIGSENLISDAPVLYIGNHRGIFDTVVTYSRVKNLTGYIAKKEMGNIPLLRLWMQKLHCLFLDRDDIKSGLKTILSAIDLVKSGISVTIFPEGTRNKTSEPLLPFHEGSFKIAQKTGCAIIPMTINNAENILEAHFPLLRPGKMVLEFGKPIYIQDLSREQQKAVGAYVREIMEKTYLKNQALISK